MAKKFTEVESMRRNSLHAFSVSFIILYCRNITVNLIYRNNLQKGLNGLSIAFLNRHDSVKNTIIVFKT